MTNDNKFIETCEKFNELQDNLLRRLYPNVLYWHQQPTNGADNSIKDTDLLPVGQRQHNP